MDHDLDDLTWAHAATSALLARLDVDDWLRGTPCDGWDVTAVVRHLVTGDRAFTVSLGGRAYDLPAIAAEVASVPVADLPAAYDDTGHALRDALADPPSGPLPSGIGPITAPQIAHLRTLESLVHGWDVSTAAGRGLGVDPGVARRAVEHARALVERLPADRTPFGPAQPVPADVPAIDRLVAFLGRVPPQDRPAP